MILGSATQELLAGLSAALPGIGAGILRPDGGIESSFGVAAGLSELANGDADPLQRLQRRAVVVSLPRGGSLVVTVPTAAAHLVPWVSNLLHMHAEHEQIECDMDSMNHSALQLLEQVAALGETLPQLSACETDADVAAHVLRACMRATAVERAVYLHLHPRTGACEVLVHMAQGRDGAVVQEPWPADAMLDADRGIVADAIASSETSVVRQVRRGDGRPGSAESLARSEVLGVQVGYDDGDRRVALGAILLFDKIRSGYSAAVEQLGSEEGKVAASFASMLGAVLGARQTAELGKEMRMAQAIQAQILPERPAVVPGFELAGDYRTSGAVGGDYFDYVPMADGRTLAVVADVSGHNLASGMVMVSARATLRTLAAGAREPADVFGRLAASMFDDLSRTERFLTAVGIALRPGECAVEVVSAGHNPVLHFVARDGAVRPIASDGPILGFLPQPSYDAQRVVLAPGDCLLAYTDGVTEAQDERGEMFGDERLHAIVAATASRGARALVDAVLAAVRAFEGADARGDDVTVLAICARPGRGEPA